MAFGLAGWLLTVPGGRDWSAWLLHFGAAARLRALKANCRAELSASAGWPGRLQRLPDL